MMDNRPHWSWLHGWYCNYVGRNAAGYADHCLTPWGAWFAAWRLTK